MCQQCLLYRMIISYLSTYKKIWGSYDSELNQSPTEPTRFCVSKLAYDIVCMHSN